jgi:chromosome segregation protein
MARIKKIVMQGFKSFAKRTEIPLDQTLSVIVGPNGSGKSNVTDAICFVLGRLSAKSMRAAKTANLIYNGGKGNSPADEATVEMIFDNSSNEFAINKPDIKIARIVRRNGQSIYRINDETKTRQEVLELLNQGGIDPDGFNIILQGEISRFIEMHHEERRQIVEEVSGIAVYEDKKAKSLNELAKTDERLKEVTIILKQRHEYLQNLEAERQEALKHKQYEESIKRDKATILHKNIKDKNTEKEKLDINLEENQKALEKQKQEHEKIRNEISELNIQINEINNKIQEATGLQQEELHKDLAECGADIAGLSVRLENYKQQLNDNESRKEQLGKDIKRLQSEIEDLKKSIPKEDYNKLLKSKSTAFTSIEEKKTHLDKLKMDFNSVKINLENSRKNYDRAIFEISKTQEKINELLKSSGKTKEEIKKIDKVIDEIEKSSLQVKELEKKRIFCVSDIAEMKKEISIIEKLKHDIVKLDTCPVCKRKVTEQHIKEVTEKADSDIKSISLKLEKLEKSRKEFESEIEKLNKKLPELREEEKKLHIGRINLKIVEDKELEKEKFEKERLELSEIIQNLEKKYRNLETEISGLKEIEEEYNQIKGEIKEIGSKHDVKTKVGLEIANKQMEIDQSQATLRKVQKESPELQQTIDELTEQLDEKQDMMKEKEKQDTQLKKNFESMFVKRNKIQDTAREKEMNLVNKQGLIREIEIAVNNVNIALAKVCADLTVLNNEFKQYEGIKIVEASRHELEERIHKNEVALQAMGSVNLRALDVYDNVKLEYDKIAEKVAVLEKEKEGVIKIIEEIDKKKKKSFMDVFNAINKGFAENFLKLGGREAYLELENEQDPFIGGIDIVVKLSQGRYLDVNSLSGGERTLVALSLIFAIQEYRPYSFYIFDEIDAALDKRNSERLSIIIKNYIKNAQYIIITHNDSLITEATSIYGVSMQDGVSKVISLKV